MKRKHNLKDISELLYCKEFLNAFNQLKTVCNTREFDIYFNHEWNIKIKKYYT